MSDWRHGAQTLPVSSAWGPRKAPVHAGRTRARHKEGRRFPLPRGNRCPNVFQGPGTGALTRSPQGAGKGPGARRTAACRAAVHVKEGRGAPVPATAILETKGAWSHGQAPGRKRKSKAAGEKDRITRLNIVSCPKGKSEPLRPRPQRASTSSPAQPPPGPRGGRTAPRACATGRARRPFPRRARRNAAVT